MIFVVSKRNLVLLGLFCCFFTALAAVLWTGHDPAAPAFAIRQGVPVTVVVDPGHGGEDGGAVSPDGTVESHLNLAVAWDTYDLLRFLGQRAVMSRTEDVALYTGSPESIHQKKVSDLQNRVALVNGTEGAVLLSIHQNSLPSSPVTHGAQVFWNQQEGAEELAASVQTALNQAINTTRAKEPKEIGATIYLMKHITAPGIIVECGFLSNQEETRRLQEPAYQRKLAVAITAGCRAAGEELG